MLLPLLAALALADAACAGIADTPRQAAVVAGFQRRSLAAAPAAGQEPPLLPAPVGALSPRGRPLLQAQDSAPASLPTAEQQAGAGGAPQLPLSLDSPIPFYAALLQPALEPYLPPPEAAEERQQALQRLATQLAPAVDAALNETREQLGALLDAVEEQLGAGAGDAGVAAIQTSPDFWAAIGETLNDTTDALARWPGGGLGSAPAPAEAWSHRLPRRQPLLLPPRSTLTAAAESAACIVFDSLLAGAKRGGPSLRPVPTSFPTFREQFVPGFVAGLIRGVLDAAYGASSQPAAVVGGFDRRRALLQAAERGQRATGTSHGGAVVGCAGGECRRHWVQDGSPPGAITAPMSASEALEEASSGLRRQAAAVGGAAVEAGVLAGGGALRAASAVLQAAAQGLQDELDGPVDASSRRRDMLQPTVAGPIPEEAFVTAVPQPEAVLLAPLPMPELAVLAPSGEAEPGAPPSLVGVQNAIQGGTQAATRGIQGVSQTAAGAVGGAADVAAGAAEAANQLALGTAQSGAQVAAAVQNLVETALAVGQLASQTG